MESLTADPLETPTFPKGLRAIYQSYYVQAKRDCTFFSFGGGLPLKLLEWYCFWLTLLERRIIINVSITVLTFQKSGSSCRNKVPITDSVTELECAHREWL